MKKKKNNIAGKWKVLNTVMGTPCFGSEYPDHFVNNDIVISNKKDITNMLKTYFTNIGPELSKDITIPTNASIYDYLENRNNQTLFLTSVSEEEVIRTVNNLECKTSTHCGNIYMLFIKKQLLITMQNLLCIFISDPSLLEYSLKKMKTATFIPLLKSGDRYMCTN